MVKKRMRLLAIASCYPFPPQTGGGIVICNQLKELSKRHFIHFICSDVERERESCPGYIHQVEVISRKKTLKFVRLLGMLFGYAPTILAYKSDEMCSRVRDVMACNDFDAVLLYELNSIQYCPSAYYGKAIVNVEDPQSIKLERMRKLLAGSLFEKMKLWVNSVFTRRYEAAILPKLGRVLTLSEGDMRDLQIQGDYGNVGYVTYGIDPKPDAEILDWDNRTDGMIVFSGSMYHRPNVDGILFFLSSVFAFILEAQPVAVLWIVGAEPDTQIREAAARFGDRVVITGTVNDVSEYLRRARVSICPVRLKIGVQTKILEALSWATPVVTTSAGNSGIGGTSGSGIWVEDESEQFAGRVASLLRGDHWARFSEKGRQFAAERHSWTHSVAQLEHYISLVSTTD